jgi:hypothetical protein
LQKAYASAPLATATLLTQALQALAQIETTLIAQNQSLTSAETSNAVVDNSVSSTSFANVAATAAGVVTSVAEPVASTHMLVQETVAPIRLIQLPGSRVRWGKQRKRHFGRSSYVCANCGCQCSVFRI